MTALCYCVVRLINAPDKRQAIDSHIRGFGRKTHAVRSGCECIAPVYGVGYRLDTPE
jgi:DNA-binding response OmpR family regulator